MKKKDALKTTDHSRKHSVLQRILTKHNSAKVDLKQDLHKSYNGMLEETAAELASSQTSNNMQGEMLNCSTVSTRPNSIRKAQSRKS